ncbi:hypothetical protein BD779DRAFT_1484858 [Infundibulicybe gibba]|nr:hypothetical protein BD779DRAFT_1484858 [Infundibulicybe gibba]
MTPAAEANQCDDVEAIEMDTLTSMQTIQHSPSKSPIPNALNKKDYAIGIGLLLIVVILWTSSNFVTQALFDTGYEKPFLVTYLNTSAFTLYLVPFLIRRWWEPRDEYQPLTAEPEADDLSEETSRSSPPAEHQSSPKQILPPLTLRETATLAYTFCFFWFVANWAVNASLDYTSVASATILSSMSGFFTLGIGRLFRVETLTFAKIGAVLTSFSGVLLVSLSDSSAKPEGASHRIVTHSANHARRPVLGDALALLSAIFYALYVILLKVKIQSESRVDMQLFFGFVGLFNILSCWPIGIILHLTGVEVFALPTTNQVVYAILLNMAITLSSDYLYVLAMLKTTPLVVTVGLSLTIPLAVLAILVLASFVVVGVYNSNPEERVGLPVQGVVGDHDGGDRQVRARLSEAVELVFLS